MSRKKKRLPVEQVFAWTKDGTGLVVVESDVLKTYNTAHLSASTAKAMEGCAARWAVEKYLPWDDNPFSPANLGTSGHEVLEVLFTCDPADRTPKQAEKILHRHAAKKWGKSAENQAKRDKWIKEVKAAYSGVFKLEDPAEVKVHSIELRLDGIEVGGVPFKGFVDRIDVTDKGLRILDYKTGKVPTNIRRFGDDHGDQIRLYKAALEATGEKVAKGNLYYTRHGKARNVPIGKTTLNRTLKQFSASYDELVKHVHRGEFPTKTSALCGWCPLVSVCAAAKAEGLEARAEGLPTAKEMPVPTLDEKAPVNPPVLNEVQRKRKREQEAFTEFVDEMMKPWRDKATAGHKGGKTTKKEAPMEQKPWIELSGNGELNYNSYSATAVVGLANWAYEMLADAGIEPSRKSIDALMGTLAAIIVAVEERHTGSMSWQSGANVRIRGALRTFTEVHPAPFGGTKDKWKSWANTAAKHTSAIVGAGVRLHANTPRLADAPWEAIVDATGAKKRKAAQSRKKAGSA